MENLPKDKKIILFDGVCNLCDKAVQYIIVQDKKDIFRFVALQSDLGKAITSYLGIDTAKLDSIILYEPGTAYYIKGEAVLRVAKLIGGWPSLLSIFGILPKKIQDWVYDFMARNRYKWYGKKESCLVPATAIQSKFLA